MGRSGLGSPAPPLRPNPYEPNPYEIPAGTYRTTGRHAPSGGG